MALTIVARAPFHVLVLPYALDAFPQMAYALVRANASRDSGWCGLSGAGNRGETPAQAARRCASQLAGVPADAAYIALDSRSTIAVEHCHGACDLAEYAFGARVDPEELQVPDDERELCWVSYEVARGLLQRDLERDALWELRRRLGCRPVWG